MKYVKSGIFALGFAMAIGANVDCAQAQPATVIPPTEIVLKVSPAELDIISEGLQTQPFGKVVPLINKLRSQVMEQQPKPPASVAPTVSTSPKE